MVPVPEQLAPVSGRCVLPDEAATIGLGKRLAAALAAPAVIFLYGELGAGKTTLCRGLLHALGHRGAVKSPTYTLVEPYELPGWRVYHFDLYRLGDPEELEYLGMRDYLGAGAVLLIEWAERGVGHLPPADIELRLDMRDHGRQVSWRASTPRGVEIIARLEAGPGRA